VLGLEPLLELIEERKHPSNTIMQFITVNLCKGHTTLATGLRHQCTYVCMLIKRPWLKSTPLSNMARLRILLLFPKFGNIQGRWGATDSYSSTRQRQTR
jgi:hypothetical protein